MADLNNPFEINRQSYNLRIENALYFLQSQYHDLTKIAVDNIGLEKFKSIEDVYVACLIYSVNLIAKRGFYKEYIRHADDELVSPKGSINISKSLSTQSMLRGKLVCSYDELSDNVIHNKIIKSVLVWMSHRDVIDSDLKFEVKKCLTLFNGVDTVEVKGINWRNLKFNNSNIRYKTAIGLCKYLIDVVNIEKITDYSFDNKLYMLFKNQLFDFYLREFGKDYRVFCDRVSYPFGISKFEKLSGNSNSLVRIETDKKTLFIECLQYNNRLSPSEQDKQLIHLKHETDDYCSDHVQKVICAIIYCNSGCGYLESDFTIVNVEHRTTIYTIMDMNISSKFIFNKLKSLLKLVMSNNI